MKHRVPAARWIATATVIAVLAVFSALALRMWAGGDPAVGAAHAQARGDDPVPTLFGEDDDDGGSSSLPGSAPTTRAS